MNNRIPPEPPTPPEGRLVCGACGYSAPKSEFNHDVWHKPELITMCILFSLFPLSVIIIVLTEIF